LAKAGQFPRPVRITARSSGWLLDEIQEWQAARIAARDAESKWYPLASAPKHSRPSNPPTTWPSLRTLPTAKF